MGSINNIPALVQIMAWLQPGDKQLHETTMFSLLTHIYITQPQRVKKISHVLMWQEQRTAFTPNRLLDL